MGIVGRVGEHEIREDSYDLVSARVSCSFAADASADRVLTGEELFLEGLVHDSDKRRRSVVLRRESRAPKGQRRGAGLFERHATPQVVLNREFEVRLSSRFTSSSSLRRRRNDIQRLSNSRSQSILCS